MKILFYISASDNYVNRYNVSEVITHFTDVEFKIIEVQLKNINTENKPSLISLLKQAKYNLVNGKNILKIDEQKLSEKFDAKIDAKALGSISIEQVEKVNDSKSVELIKAFNPDFIIQAGAGIIKPCIFELAKKGTLNVHHGVAPEIRGMKSTLWCLHYGLFDKIGVTCHLIDENLDTGNIIQQFRYKHTSGDSYLRIQEVLVLEGAQLLINSIHALNKAHSFKSTEIDSYYFSHFDYRNYTRMKKNGFVANDTPNNLKAKRKVKQVLVFD